MSTYPLDKLCCTIDATGISAPPYGDILASLQASYREIYGADVDLADDTQDGQFIAIFAKAIDDQNQSCIDVFNSFSPTYAQGVGLSSLVKINGLRRKVPSFSTAPATITGRAFTPIPDGLVEDVFGNQWALPPNIVIPFEATLDVTLTCTAPGAIQAQTDTITKIVTIMPGWNSVTNTGPAVPGNPVEDDQQLKLRQSISTSLPAQTPLEAILANIAAVSGVTRYAIYNNASDAPDANGVPAHTMAVVAEGGDAVEICTVISEKKAPGTGTYGTTKRIIIDPSGVPNPINYFMLQGIPVYARVVIRTFSGYVSTTGTLIQATIARAIQTLNIGENVYFNRLWAAANLAGEAALEVSGMTQKQLDALSNTYTVAQLYIGGAPDPTATSDVTILFNQAADCDPGNVHVVPL